MVARAAKKVYDQVKTSPAPNTPIIWSEYNATYMNQQEVTDSAFMGRGSPTTFANATAS